MNVHASTLTLGLPALSPMQIALLDALRPGVDERTVAREMSVNVPELRTIVEKLARKLEMPVQASPAKEFMQLVIEAERLAKARRASAEAVKNAAALFNGEQPTEAWQKKLAEVAAAVAKGVLISIDPYKIRPMHGQPREYFPEEEQSLLGDSLSTVGQVQDIIIRRKPPPANRVSSMSDSEPGQRVWRMADTEYEICDGERRWRGAISKSLPEIRAKLIEIDDEGAYLVAAVSNFNRVGHTVLERARNISRLMKGPAPLPIEVIATMQGISVSTARKLLDTLNLPSDIQALMDPVAQKARGEQILGKVPSYEIARLASNPSLHEHARNLARRYVRDEIKLPQVRTEVDRILARSGSRHDVGERHQPARRLRHAESRITQAINLMRDARARLQDLKDAEILPRNTQDLGRNLNELADLVEETLEIIGGTRTRAEK